MHKSVELHVLLKSEVRSALAKMKTNKAAGTDDMILEILTILDDYLIEVTNGFWERISVDEICQRNMVEKTVNAKNQLDEEGNKK